MRLILFFLNNEVIGMHYDCNKREKKASAISGEQL